MDLRLVSSSFNDLQPRFDLMLTSGGIISEEEELATAIIVALGTDRRAYDDDELPGIDNDDDRRGFWGDLDAREIWGGWPVGSRLWLLERSSIVGSRARTGALIARIEQYVYEALEPFIINRIASRVTVEAERSGQNAVNCTVTIYRGPKPSIALEFQSVWNNVRT